MTVLLFMTLTFILITSMLTVTGNEVVIASLQRDGVRALDLAQGALQEAVRRMEEGRPFQRGFTSSLSSAATVTVVRRYAGTNSAYQEITATATLGRSTRRISFLVLQRNITFPPNITFAASVIEAGSAQISCGDAYARTFIQYKDYPSNDPPCTEPPNITYSGWRISKVEPGPVAPCYTNAGCIAANPAKPDVARWYPGTRHTEEQISTIGLDVAAQKNKCPAGGGGSLPGNLVTGTLADGTAVVNVPAYGFDTDDPDGAGPIAPQAVTAALPCGLPYKLEPETFADELGVNQTRLMKKIVFEHWFANYWQFNEAKMNYEKKTNLTSYPQYGAVPPFPEVDTVNSNFDCKKDGGGTISSLPITCDTPAATSTDLGCYAAVMTCTPAADRQVMLVLEGGPWTINGTLQGHGTIVVNGDLVVNGNFEYWGTIIVNGTLTLGAGSAVIHGGLVADNTLQISGNITVEGGGTVSNVPTGRSIITGKGWWER